jgi:hypothetical protein
MTLDLEKEAREAWADHTSRQPTTYEVEWLVGVLRSAAERAVAPIEKSRARWIEEARRLSINSDNWRARARKAEVESAELLLKIARLQERQSEAEGAMTLDLEKEAREWLAEQRALAYERTHVEELMGRPIERRPAWIEQWEADALTALLRSVAERARQEKE